MITVDGYSELERIGHGGLGDVYRATRDSTGGTVAIKVLRDVSDESVAWHRTRRELTALVSLSGHAHVIQLLELLDLPEGPALVMEYAPGGSVSDLLARRGLVLTVPEVVFIGRHTADALVAAHEQDIVHRDLKPQNLLIDAYGRIKLCDFGIASLARSEEFQTRTNALSLRYASPEDLDEEAEVGPASDVYSLGATLLHLVHGTPLTMKDRLQPWTPPPSDDAELASLDEVIARCLRTDPEERPPSTEVLEQLEHIDWTLTERCRGLPVEAPVPANDTPAVAASISSPADPHDPHAAPDALAGTDFTASTTARRSDAVVPPAPPRPTAEPTRRRWPWIVGAIAVAALVGVGAALLWPTDDPSDTATGPVATTVPDATDASGDTTTVTTSAIEVVDRPAGLVAIDDPSVTWPFGSVGECLVQVNGLAELMPIDCAEPHDLQRFAVAELDLAAFPADAPFDAATVETTTDDACIEAFAPFVGVDPADSMFDIAVTRPSADTWSGGDRRYQCLLGVTDHLTIGTAENARL